MKQPFFLFFFSFQKMSTKRKSRLKYSNVYPHFNALRNAGRHICKCFVSSDSDCEHFTYLKKANQRWSNWRQSSCVVDASGRYRSCEGRGMPETCFLQLKISGFVKNTGFNIPFKRPRSAQSERSIAWINSISFFVWIVTLDFGALFRRSFDPSGRKMNLLQKGTLNPPCLRHSLLKLLAVSPVGFPERLSSRAPSWRTSFQRIQSWAKSGEFTWDPRARTCQLLTPFFSMPKFSNTRQSSSALELEQASEYFCATTLLNGKFKCF